MRVYIYRRGATHKHCEMATKGDPKGLTTEQAAEDSPTAVYLELYEFGLECPTSDAEVQALVSEYNLKHGDVVNFGDYRDTNSHIVFRQEDGKLTLIANPDDRSAGYLTIPKVLKTSSIINSIVTIKFLCLVQSNYAHFGNYVHFYVLRTLACCVIDIVVKLCSGQRKSHNLS